MAPASERVLPISAIVASRNEAKLLARCLDALSFCAERIVIDLESTDDTRAVAEAHGARVIEHPLVPIVEQARAAVIETARYDWLLVRDPDEIVPPALADDLIGLFDQLGPRVGVVGAPTQRYFRDRPLRGTVWGGVQGDRLLARRGLTEFPTTVHAPLLRAEGCEDATIPFDGSNAIAHYWAGGYRQLLEKHRRYLKHEGVRRVDAGELAGIRSVLATPMRAFVDCFVRHRGYRDRLDGLLLSLLWAWYRTGTQLAVYREIQRRAARA